MSIFDKAKDMLNSPEIEEKSDAVLDKAEEIASTKIDADKVSKVRDVIDSKIGNE